MHDVKSSRPDVRPEVSPSRHLERVVERQGQRHQRRPSLVGIAAQPRREAKYGLLEPVEINCGEIAALDEPGAEDGFAVDRPRDQMHVGDFCQRARVRPTDPGHALRLRMGGFGKHQDAVASSGHQGFAPTPYCCGRKRPRNVSLPKPVAAMHRPLMPSWRRHG